MTGRLTEAFEFAGELVRARLTLNEEEQRRRRGTRLEAPSAEVLEALFVLPLGLTVRLESLATWALAALESAPDWTIDMNNLMVRRRYDPIAVVREVTVANPAMHREAQIENLRWLTAVAPRSLVIPQRSADLAREVSSTDSGLGLIAVSQEGTWARLRPASTIRVRSTSQRWLLAERAAAALSSSAAERPSMP